MLRGGATRKGRAGGREGTRETFGYSTPIRIATWNCGGLSNVTMSICKDLGYDILGITETHGWNRDPHALYSERPPPGDKYSGCCIALSPHARRAVMHSGTVGSRIVFARLRGRPFNLFLICIYVPHKGRTEPAQVDTYCQLEELLETVPKRDAVILLGDFNSRLHRHAGNGRLVGRWCMHTRADRGGTKLENLMEKHRLRAVSTYFQPAGRRAPCTYINKTPTLAPSQIDYVIVSERWSSSIRSCKVKWEPSIRRFGRGKYDHGLVAAVLRHRTTASKRIARRNYCALSFGPDREKHELTRKFNQGVRAALEAATEVNSIDGKWERLKEAVNKAAEILPSVSRPPGGKRWTPSIRTMQLVKDRENRGAKMKDEERKALTRQISHSCRADYREHVELLVRQVEAANSVGDHSRVSRLTKSLKIRKSGTKFTQPSKTSDGTQITTTETATEEWASFVEQKFARHDGIDVPPGSENTTEIVPPISPDEVHACLDKMQRRKATGTDGIPVEAYQASKNAAEELTSLLIEIWETEQMPTEMAVGTMIMMHKKGDKDDKGNYRALCLLPHAFKILSMCLLHRIRPYAEQTLPDTQAGFRPTRGCRDNTCILAWTVDWMLEQGRSAIITYIDFKSAFDSINHSFLLSSLRSYGCPEKYVRLVSLMYETASVTVRVQLKDGIQAYSRKVHVRRGVLQGDILSPLCFIIALDRIFQRHNTSNAGVSLTPSIRLNKLEYADDVGLMDENATDASERLSKLSDGANSEGGLIIAIQKSFAQHIQKAQRVSRTTEEDVDTMDFKFKCDNCDRKFPYPSSLATHRRLHCKPRTPTVEQNPFPCPSSGTTIAIRKWDDLGRFDWHLCVVARINDRKRMRVSVEYFDDEPRESLHLTNEQWGIVKTHPHRDEASRSGSVADRLVKQTKRKAAQERFEQVKIGDEKLTNVLHFKYLGVMQSGDGDPLVPVTHRTMLAWSRFGQLKRVLTEKKLSKSLRLRIFSSCVVSTLLYGCEAWKLTEQVRRKLNATGSKMLSKITGRHIAAEAREPSIDIVLRARDQRWNWLGHILRMNERRTVRQVLLHCVKPTAESLFSDVPDLNIDKALKIAMNRIEWKNLRPSKRC